MHLDDGEVEAPNKMGDWRSFAYTVVYLAVKSEGIEKQIHGTMVQGWGEE